MEQFKRGLSSNMGIVTNCHVVQGQFVVTVKRNGASEEAFVIYCDLEKDIAVITAKGDLPSVRTRPAAALAVGEQVYAVGAPQGLELSVSEGIVGQLRQASGGLIIQTTAAISAGSSGGGLFDAQGRLIGVTTMQFKDGQNLNFAMPVEWAIAALDIARREPWKYGMAVASQAPEKVSEVPRVAEPPTREPSCGWQQVGAVGKYDYEQFDIYVDPCTVRPLGQYMAVWALDDFVRTRTTTLGKNYRSTKSRSLIDCKNWRFAISSASYFSEPMGSGDLVGSGGGQIKFDDIPPGTVAEAKAKVACKR
jgi:Trypsin-like peptidase domain